MRLDPRPSGSRGFTLTELAVVLVIVALLLSGLMYTLSAQIEQKNFEETRRRLELARELILSYAIVNGRLPCPARSTSSGAEVRDTTTGQCVSGGVNDYYGGTLAGSVTGGLLPAQTIGYQHVDAGGFAVDAWQNRVRYAVARTNVACNTTPPAGTILFTHAANLKTYGISCQSNDLLVCKSATANDATASPPSCGGLGANQHMSTGLVAAIVFSTGKNGLPGGTDEAANLDGNALFVWHTPTPITAANGEFDDQFTWITIGEFYGKLISAGVLP
jgi:prepilin-type N-terminal cleavage/methylation domain-containing protein